MTIINQDRDNHIHYTNQRLFCLPVYMASKDLTVIGFNIYAEGEEDFLGTFDNVWEAVGEMVSIQNCENDEYYVNGYSGELNEYGEM